VVAHEIRAGHVTPDAAGRLEALALPPVGSRRKENLLRHHTVLDDLLVVVQIVNKEIQCENPLLQDALDMILFRGGHDARHKVEGEDFLGARTFAIHIERDAHTAKDQIGFLPFAGEDARVGGSQPVVNGAIGSPDLRLLSPLCKVLKRAAANHFVKEDRSRHR